MMTQDFNPRTRTGCDMANGIWDEARKISIHAPARGATHFAGVPSPRNSDFNPRTRTGCDLLPAVEVSIQYDFNPRARTGCDPDPAVASAC